MALVTSFRPTSCLFGNANEASLVCNNWLLRSFVPMLRLAEVYVHTVKLTTVCSSFPMHHAVQFLLLWSSCVYIRWKGKYNLHAGFILFSF